MKILVSAFEHSANIHLKSVLKELHCDYTLSGIFDETLGNPIVDMQKQAVMGFSDVVKKIPMFLKLANKMVELSKDADKVLLIDSSGFNLPLAKKIKKKYPDKEILYYILPQAWAWKRKRVYTLAKNVDKLLSILPFEASYYPKEAKISYVGHPLLDQIKEYKTTTAQEDKKILFMPGSRRGEISRLMPIFRELSKNFKDRELLLAVPQHLKDSLEIYGDISKFTIVHNSQKALKEADFAFICSGTATLEASIVGTPFILSYIAKPIDYYIGKKLIKLNYIGLANIFFEHMKKEPIHPELIQHNVTTENLLQAYKSFNRENFLKNSKILRDYLEHGSSKEVAKMLEKE
jgi:lipid-A-disaccharide synthase